MWWDIACFLLACLVAIIHAKKVPPPKCRRTSEVGRRSLHVLYCNTRMSEELFDLFQENTGVNRIKESFDGQLHVMNSCHNSTWRGWDTKVAKYASSIDHIISERRKTGTQNIPTSIMLADTDTLWSVTSVKDIFEMYDCVRKDKDLVMSTEVMCWVGRHCTESDIKLFYSNISSPSYSSFINAGLSMGSPHALLKLLDFVLHSELSYVPKGGLNDQRGYALYSATFPHLVAPDYHQQLFGSAVAFVLHSDVISPCRIGTCEPVVKYDILYKSSF